MTTTLHGVTFPNETADYRAARKELLKAELELKRQTEQVAALRRSLPMGGLLQEDYTFTTWKNGQKVPVRFSELFEGDKNSLIAYHMMYSPDMAQPCPMCSSFVDGLNSVATNLRQKANMVVMCKSPVERLVELANTRGWKNLPLVSTFGTTYSVDYHAEAADGSQDPMMNTFERKDGKIYHFWASELHSVAADNGQDPRHIDIMWPLWNVFDTTREGRPNWYPKLSY